MLRNYFFVQKDFKKMKQQYLCGDCTGVSAPQLMLLMLRALHQIPRKVYF